ncbi:MAG: heavy metal translocating P-type ATPase [Promethearchaeati archaeon SRVP18_Atabeyarchaeia-1]
MVECHEEHAGKVCAACALEYSRFRSYVSIWRDRRIILIGASASTLFAGLFTDLVSNLQNPAEILLLISAIMPGYSIVKKGLSSLVRDKTLGIDFLITIAALGAFLIGHGQEGAAVIFLYYVAEFLEDHASDRAKKSIANLIRLAPEVAVVERGKRGVKVHAHNVHVGDIAYIRPGGKIPLDGEIIDGISSVNQAPITGESVPVTKQVGDTVYAGTVNCEGFLRIKVTKTSGETMLSKIVKLVEDAQKEKSPIEKFVDRFSRYYTPIVILLAAIVAVVPAFLFGLSFSDWVYKALVLLVISCPCALVLSTPVTMISGMTNAAKNGVLIKGSNYLEQIGKVKVFAFDKTGTLTEGKLEVTDIVSFERHDSVEGDGVLVKAASLEALSEHPIAKAIVRRAELEGVQIRPVNNFRAILGRGVAGEIDGKVYYAGNEKMFEDSSIEYPFKRAQRIQNEGKTVILVGGGGKAIGLIAVMDKIRDGSINAIAELKKNGIRTEMITGDNEMAARTIAKITGVDAYKAELLPENKAKVIERLVRRYAGVAMVGDGVNDAPALVRADVGIAMGAAGSDAAIETADVALMHDDLSKLSYLMRLSKKSLAIIKRNVLASLLVKGILAVLVFPGLITLWLAVAVGDMGLSLAVVINAMRLSLLY